MELRQRLGSQASNNGSTKLSQHHGDVIRRVEMARYVWKWCGVYGDLWR